MKNREKTPILPSGPCIGLIETRSIARGIDGADQILKTAHCRILLARAVSQGKYIVLFDGSVEDVTSALTRVRERFEDDLIDDLILQNVDPTVVEAISGEVRELRLDALGIVETYSVAAAITAADAAVKKGRVDLVDMHLAVGIGGKAYFTLTGNVADVEAAVDVATQTASERGQHIASVVIPRPHPEMQHVVEG
jgi:microcompartment protein CcmL/EutN